jgi:hypothetical protein
MTRDDVIDVLTVVAAATRRTVGEADVTIWQGVIGGDDKPLALRAVRDHLAQCPGVWLEPGHVHQRVRAYIRDRLEREPDELRERRQAELDAKVAQEIAEHAGHAKSLPYERPTKRHGVNPLSVRCPWCHMGVGQHCVVPQTSRRPAGGAHPSRIEAAAGVSV